MRLFDRTEHRIWTWTLNFYATQKQDYCCEECQNWPRLVYWTQSTKCSCSQFRACGRNGKNNTKTAGMVKTTLKQLEKRFTSFYMASDLYLSIWSFWNTELRPVQVKQSVFRDKAEKCRPSFLLGSTFVQYLFRLLLYFRTGSPWMWLFLLNASLPFYCV